MSKTKKNLTRRQRARREKEAQFQKTLTWIVVGVVSLIVIIIGYGIFAEAQTSQKPVARVYDETISTKEYQARQSYERLMAQMEIAQYDQYLLQYQNTPEMAEFAQQFELAKANLENQLSADMANIFGGQVLDTMIEEELVRQEAKSRDIAVSQEAVDERIESFLGYDREAMETITDTTDIPEFSEYYAAFKTNILDAASLSEQDFKEMMRAQVLRERLIEVMSSDMTSTTEQIQGTLFIVDSEEAGNEITRRINEGGEAIEAIAEELNDPEAAGTASFPIDWTTAGFLSSQISPELEEAAWNADVGEATSPIAGNDGSYYVFYVSGHEERPLEGNLLQEAQQEKYNQWLEEQRTEHTEYLDNWQDAVVTEP